MLKNILNIEGAQKLTNSEQKAINGGRPAPGPCVDSNIVCTNTGNAGCPIGQGCELIDNGGPVYAICKCL